MTSDREGIQYVQNFTAYLCHCLSTATRPGVTLLHPRVLPEIEPYGIWDGQGGLLSRERARREERDFLVLGFLLSGFGFRVSVIWFLVSGFWFLVSRFGFQVLVSGFRLLGFLHPRS